MSSVNKVSTSSSIIRIAIHQDLFESTILMKMEQEIHGPFLYLVIDWIGWFMDLCSEKTLFIINP